MENILNYLENHYILFVVITVLLIFALVGYFAKKKADAEKPYKLADENTKAELELENIVQNVNKGASIQDFMNHKVKYEQPVENGQNSVQQSQATQQQVGEEILQPAPGSNETTTAQSIESNNQQYPEI